MASFLYIYENISAFMRCLLLFFFLLSASLLAQPLKKISPDQIQQLEERLYSEAFGKTMLEKEKYIDSLLRVTGNNPAVQLCVGKFWTFVDLKRAESVFMLLLNQKVDKSILAKTNYYLGNVSFHLEKYQSAIHYYLQAEQLKYDKEKVYLELGNTYFMLSKYETAESYFSKAFEQHSLPAILGLVGIVYEVRAKYTQALEFYQRADKAYYGNVPAYSINLIQLFMRLGQYSAAKQVAIRSLADFPYESNVQGELLEIYRKLGQLDSLEIYLNKARNTFPHTNENFAVLGYFYDEIGQLDSAVYFFKLCLEQGPGHVASAIRLSNILSKIGYYCEAHQVIDRAMQVDDQEYLLYINKIYAYMWEQKLDSSYWWTMKMAEKLPTANLDFVMGYSSLLYGKNEDALKYFKKELKRKPNDDRVNNNLGRAYFNLGILDSAEYFINKSLAIQSKNAFAWHNRAALNLKLGRIEVACEDLENAIKYEYTWIIDAPLKSMAKQHCAHIETDYEPAIKEYKMNRKGLRNVDFFSDEKGMIQRVGEILSVKQLYETKEKPLERVLHYRYVFDYFLHFVTILDLDRLTLGVDFVYTHEKDLRMKLFNANGELIWDKTVKHIVHEKIDLSKYPIQKYVLTVIHEKNIVAVAGINFEL